MRVERENGWDTCKPHNFYYSIAQSTHAYEKLHTQKNASRLFLEQIRNLHHVARSWPSAFAHMFSQIDFSNHINLHFLTLSHNVYGFRKYSMSNFLQYKTIQFHWLLIMKYCKNKIRQNNYILCKQLIINSAQFYSTLC